MTYNVTYVCSSQNYMRKQLCKYAFKYNKDNTQSVLNLLYF